MKLSLSRAHFPIHTLGPGKRIGIWFQGCSIQCPGCVSTDTWAGGKGATTVNAFMDAISPWLELSDGVTVSGGEPFDQEDALREILVRLRESTTGNILIYSGYSWEALVPRLARFEGLIDALITDPFLADSPQTLALRGSDNQRLHYLSAIGKAMFQAYNRSIIPTDQVLDVMIEGDQVWMAGIPLRGDLQKLSAFMDAGGNFITTTEGLIRSDIRTV